MKNKGGKYGVTRRQGTEEAKGKGRNVEKRMWGTKK